MITFHAPSDDKQWQDFGSGMIKAGPQYQNTSQKLLGRCFRQETGYSPTKMATTTTRNLDCRRQAVVVDMVKPLSSAGTNYLKIDLVLPLQRIGANFRRIAGDNLPQRDGKGRRLHTGAPFSSQNRSKLRTGGNIMDASTWI